MKKQNRKAKENLSPKGKSGDTHGASAMQGSSGEDSVFSREELVKPSDTILLKDFDKFIAELKDYINCDMVFYEGDDKDLQDELKEDLEFEIDKLAMKVREGK